jgi:uroporphyrinogen decarboxylase
MTKRELVLRAFNNQPVERLPVSFWFHFVSDAEKTQGLEKPALIEQNVAGHRRYVEAVQPDFIKIMSDGYFGYPENTNLSPIITSLDDLNKLQAIDADHPWIQGQISLVKRVAALQADTMYFYNVFGPATVLVRLAGREKTIEFLKTAPEVTAAALERIAHGIAVQAEAVITHGGADGIYFSVQNPDITRISDEEYHRLAAPADRIVLDAANKASEYNILHICGYRGAKNHLEAWKQYQAKAYNWAVNVEGVSLAEGKRIFGGAAVIGGFANTADAPVCRGSRAEVEALTEKIVAEAGKTGVLLGADCTVPDDFPVERLEWVRRKASML